MRSLLFAAILLVCGGCGGCSKDNKATTADAAPSAVSSADLSPDAATVSITIDGKPLQPASVAAIQTARFKEKDPKKAPNLVVTIDDPKRNTLSFDIPWNDGAPGDIADVRVTYATKDASYSNLQPAHVNVTRVDASDAGHLYDANFDVTLGVPGRQDTVAVRGSFVRLRVKGSIGHLQRL